jgi:hypothetical protein
MAISPIDISMMQRMNEVASIRQNEMNKPEVQQITIARDMEKQSALNAEQVRAKDDAGKSNTEHDAKEKGKNFYYGDGGKNKKKKEEGKVIVKGSKSFDLKI